jgi:hypothetical protein
MRIITITLQSPPHLQNLVEFVDVSSPVYREEVFFNGAPPSSPGEHVVKLERAQGPGCSFVADDVAKHIQAI